VSAGTKFSKSSIVYKLYAQDKAYKIAQVASINSAMHQNAFKRERIQIWLLHWIIPP
jgi:hypothetical protein